MTPLPHALKIVYVLVVFVQSTCMSGNSIAEDAIPANRNIQFEDFVGADQCAACHPAVYDAWRESTHGLAGGEPSSAEFVGTFDGTILRFSDAEVTLETDQKQRFFYHVDRPGRPRETFEVAGFVGGGHMMGGGTQTSFSEYSDGSWRLLPFDYSKHSDLWFCDTDSGWRPIDRKLSIDECVFWPPKSNFGINCGNCHSSQMQVQFDTANLRERLRFVSLAINCESCHGPGRRHAELMKREDRKHLLDIGMPALELLDKQQSVEVCFRCHAKTQFLARGYLPGKPLKDHYALNFFGENSRHIDGRSNGWSYQEGHLYSDCYLSGSMTCVDCHDPHTQKYRDINGFSLPGKLDDGQCLDCHPSKGMNVSAHTGHKKGSSGSQCVACHMPFLQQTVTGRDVQFKRSDHTIPIPRPQLDDSLELETACHNCHQDKSVTWQQEYVNKWYGEIKPHKSVISTITRLTNSGSTELANDALGGEFGQHPSAELDLLRVIGEVLEFPAAELTAEQRSRLTVIAQEQDEDLASLALSWLVDSEEGDRLLSGVSVAKRHRIAAWLKSQAVFLLARGMTERASSLLNVCVQLNRQELQCHELLAIVYDTLGRPDKSLQQQKSALAASVINLQQYEMVLDSICTLLETAVSNGMRRNPAVDRICLKENRPIPTPIAPKLQFR